MTKEVVTRDEMKAVERWENEGGRVSSLNSVRASVRSFTTEGARRERQIDARISIKQPFFSIRVSEVVQ